MPKPSLESVEKALREHGFEQEAIVKVLNSVQRLAEEEKLDKQESSEPKQRFLYTVLTMDNDNQIPKLDYPSFVIKHRDSEPILTLPDKIRSIAAAYNETKKGRRRPVETLGEVFESVPRKIWNKENIFHCTKSPAATLFAVNQL